uniref:TTF-type domain-containing protein n=1 Tax=Amphimedon queenslandica TaxID=400682 RepID=A0A1X7SJE0_AMPQE
MSLEQAEVTATSSATRKVTGTPLDIAQSLEEKPVQPHNATFPKENGRSFSPSWFAKRTWLEYSVSKDAVYCYPCRFFSTGVQKGDLNRLQELEESNRNEWSNEEAHYHNAM